MPATKLYAQLYENNIETRLEKKKNSLSQPPPLFGISWAFDPPPLRNFQSLPWGGYGYFLELHITFKSACEVKIFCVLEACCVVVAK